MKKQKFEYIIKIRQKTQHGEEYGVKNEFINQYIESQYNYFINKHFINDARAIAEAERFRLKVKEDFLTYAAMGNCN